MLAFFYDKLFQKSKISKSTAVKDKEIDEFQLISDEDPQIIIKTGDIIKIRWDHLESEYLLNSLTIT